MFVILVCMHAWIFGPFIAYYSEKNTMLLKLHLNDLLPTVCEMNVIRKVTRHHHGKEYGD